MYRIRNALLQRCYLAEMDWSVVRNPTLIATAGVYGLLEYLAMNAGLFGIWLGLLLLISLGRYCYTVLRATAQGRQNLPAVSIESFNPIGDIAILSHLLLFPGLIIATAYAQPTGIIVVVPVALVFPASAALMGLSGNIAQSLNPKNLLTIAKAIGSDYLVLVCTYVGIFAGVSVLLTFVVPQFAIATAIFTFALETWALLASFALIGTVIRNHRHDFEIPGELIPREEKQIAQRLEGWRADLDRAYASMRSGLIESGYNTLHKLVEENKDSLEINHWLVENLFDWEEKKYAVEVAEKLIPRLIATDMHTDAIGLYRRCRYFDAGFTLPKKTAVSLAEYAASIGQIGLADELREMIA